MPDIPFTPAPQPQQNNPLSGTNNMLEMMGKAQALQKQNMELVGHKVAGELMQQSINPETGEPDYNKFLVSLSKDPRTAFIAPEMIGIALGQKKTSLEVLQQHMNNARTEMETIGDAFRPLAQMMSEGKTITQKDLAGVVGLLQSRGLAKTAEEAVGMFKALSSVGNPNAAVRAMMQYSRGGLESLNNTNQSIEKRYQQVEVYDPASRTMVRRPVQETYRVQGLGGMGAPGGAPDNSAGGLAPPPADRAESGPSTTRPDPTIVRPSESLQQYWDKKQTAFTAGATQLADQAQLAAQSSGKLSKILETAKGFRTGPGQTVYGQLGQIAAALGQTELGDRLRGGSIEARDQFNKYIIGNSAEAINQALGPTGGHYTDFLLKQFQSGNPSEDTSPQAIAKILAFNDKMNRLTVKRQEFVSRYEDWASKNGQVPDWGFVNRKWLNWVKGQKDPVTGELWLEVPGGNKSEKGKEK